MGLVFYILWFSGQGKVGMVVSNLFMAVVSMFWLMVLGPNSFL